MRAKKLRPLKKSPNRFRAFGQADGRQPFMPHEHLTISTFEPYPFGWAMRGAKAAFRRRCQAPFVQRWVTMPQFRFFVKEFQKKLLAAPDTAGSGSASVSPVGPIELVASVNELVGLGAATEPIPGRVKLNRLPPTE
jgi:hypothetical protein